MKTLLVFVAVLAGMLGAGERSDFSGRWNLDLKKSKGLPSSFAMVKHYTMEVDQGGDSLVINTELGGPGGSVKFPPTVVKYDGSEVYREDTLRGSKRWITASWATTGKKLVVTNKVSLRRGETEQRYTETDAWQIGKGGRLLIVVTQKFENDSTHLEERYFTRAD